MKMKKTILLALCMGAVSITAGAQIARTTVEQGEVEGTVENGLGSFKGIPFAQPPVGDLRWKAPVKPAAWTGVFKADRFAAQPYQQTQQRQGQQGPQTGEDCLYLNVLTPAKDKGEKLPVLVWIHGGGFATGNSYSNDGTSFARNGIVYVSITYRLNAFGFLSLPALTEENLKETGRAVSGNYGLLDQIMALQWVHDNIAAFGGDPDKVTIMGESAGAISVAMLCQSPLAKGLFRGAISESGGNMVPADNVRIDNNTMRNVAGSDAYGQAYIERLGLGKKSLKQLRRTDPQVFMNDSAAFSAGGALWPTYDDYVLTADAYVQYQNGNYNDVNVLIGTNSDEGSMFTGFLGGYTPAHYEHEMETSFPDPEWQSRFRAMYPGSNDQEAFDAHADIFREAAFAWPTYAWANLQSRRTADGKGQGNVYMYFFDQEKTNMFRRGQQTGRKFLSTHAVEMSYTFNTPGWGGPKDPSSEAMTQIIHRYWINFIKTGNPNGELLAHWPAYKEGEETVMYFRDGAHTALLPNTPQLELWEQYFDWRRTHLTPLK